MEVHDDTQHRHATAKPDRGNRSITTETIVQAFGKQPGDLWDVNEIDERPQQVIEACGLRELDVAATHFPPHAGVFVTLDITETDAPVWQ